MKTRNKKGQNKIKRQGEQNKKIQYTPKRYCQKKKEKKENDGEALSKKVDLGKKTAMLRLNLWQRSLCDL